MPRCPASQGFCRSLAHRQNGHQASFANAAEFFNSLLDFNAYWLPIPGQEFVEAAGGMTIGHALQDVSEPGKRLDVIELCGSDEGADGCPSNAAAVGRGLIVPGVRRAKSWSDIRFIH